MNDIFIAAVAPYPPATRKKLTQLRDLVREVAGQTPGVGQLSEELRWGQPAFLTPETGSGSTIRLDALRNDPSKVALYFHCQSGLVPQFRELYRDTLIFEKDRAIVLAVADNLPKPALAHCISLALTHHLRKKSPATRG